MQSHSNQKKTKEATAKQSRAPGCPGISDGELLSVRQTLEGDELAPGTEETLRLLRDPVCRRP